MRRFTRVRIHTFLNEALAGSFLEFRRQRGQLLLGAEILEQGIVNDGRGNQDQTGAESHLLGEFRI